MMNWWRRDRECDRAMDDEIAFHLEHRVKEYVRQGLDPAAARIKAREKFGDPEMARRSYRRLSRSKERKHGMQRVFDTMRRLLRTAAITGWVNDLRTGWRTLIRHPRQNILPVIVLALGIGLSAVALSLLHETLLAPYPFPNASELHTVWATDLGSNRQQVSMSLAEIEDFSEGTTVLRDIGYVRTLGAALTELGDGGMVTLGFVNSGYFRVLGIPPRVGRYFTAEEDEGIGAHPYAVVSHAFWKTHLSDRSDPIGAELEISAMRFNVVGVMPEEFWGPETVAGPVDVWIPVPMSPPFLGGNIYTNRAERVFWTVFRARSEADLERVVAETAPIRERLAQAYPTDHDGWGLTTMPLRQVVDGTARSAAIRLVVSAALLVLVVSCVNVASLRLIAAQQRMGEASVRLALGGTRGTLIRQHLAESLVLSIIAGGVGIGLAAGLIALLNASVALPLPAHASLALNAGALAVSLGLILGTSIVVGLLPALVTARDGQAGTRAVRPSGRLHGASSGIGSKARHAVVVLELAGTVILLQASLATVRGFQQVLQTPTGFAVEDNLTMRIDLQDGRPAPLDSVAFANYSRGRFERRWQFAEQFVERAPSLPGIGAAAVWAPTVLGASGWHARLIHGDLDPTDAGNVVMAQRHSVSAGALSVAGITILAGRDINDADGTDSIPGVVVDEALASFFWPGESAIGELFYTFGGSGQARVVGVAAKAHHRGRLSAGSDIVGDLFFPYRFWPTTTASLIVRGSVEDASRLALVRQLVSEIDPTIGIYDVDRMESRLRLQESVIRLPAFVMTIFGIIAVVLAATGILAVVDHTVQTREREIGVKRALGLDGVPLFVSLLMDTAKPVVAGAVIGVVAGRLLSSVLVSTTTVGGSPIDVAWSITALAFASTLGVAALSGLMPVTRSSRVSPAVVLREG